MSTKLPPVPYASPPGSGFWNDWYEKLRTLVNSISSSFPWSLITNTPTTLVGYGILKPTTVNDFAVDSDTHGLILKDSQTTPHYWRITVNSAGTLITTDIGTTLP